MYIQKKRGVFDPDSKTPFKISRSKMDLFIQCPRCFYMDARLGLPRPNTPPYTLNSAVDNLLKNEFDLLRKSSSRHELMDRYKIDALPYDHPDLPRWRGEVIAYGGALALDESTNLLINGLVDDLWQDPDGNLVIVDYKATSTTKEISLEDEYKQAYKRQMEIYQWIFRKLGFKVSDTGYFVFANAKKNLPKFDGKLEFEMSIVGHKGDGSWVSGVLQDIKKCLVSDKIPAPSSDCEYCAYKQLSIQAAKKIANI